MSCRPVLTFLNMHGFDAEKVFGNTDVIVAAQLSVDERVSAHHLYDLAIVCRTELNGDWMRTYRRGADDETWTLLIEDRT